MKVLQIIFTQANSASYLSTGQGAAAMLLNGWKGNRTSLLLHWSSVTHSAVYP